jgi:hypothetical protein
MGLVSNLDLMSDLTSGPFTSSTTTLCDSNMTRPSPSSLRKNQQNNLGSSTSNLSQNSSDSFDDIVKRIMSTLESNESHIQTRLKAFEELIEISELFDLKEVISLYSFKKMYMTTLTFSSYLFKKTVHNLLRAIRDLLDPDLTTLEHRRHAFEFLIQLVRKKVIQIINLLVCLKLHCILFLLNT